MLGKRPSQRRADLVQSLVGLGAQTVLVRTAPPAAGRQITTGGNGRIHMATPVYCDPWGTAG
jgi:hypothetical protein